MYMGATENSEKTGLAEKDSCWREVQASLLSGDFSWLSIFKLSSSLLLPSYFSTYSKLLPENIPFHYDYLLTGLLPLSFSTARPGDPSTQGFKILHCCIPSLNFQLMFKEFN